MDNEAGAAGSTSGAVELSHGALVAIIIVVVVVALGGSMFIPFCFSPNLPSNLVMDTNDSTSCIRRAILPG